MDRFIQFFFALILSLSSYAQCDTTIIRKTNTEGCLMVEMSPEVFSKYHADRVNLQEIDKELPFLRVAVDSLEFVNAQIDSVNIAEREILKGFEKENVLLSHSNKSLKTKVKRQRYTLISSIILIIILLCK